MRYDLFELRGLEMRWYDRAWRVAVLVFCIAVLLADLFYWRAG